LISGCGLFETRTPEQPDSKKSSFESPFSASIVINNLVNSIAEKNVEDYTKCFSDTTQGDSKPFLFIASQEATTRYQNLFNFWNLANERRYFLSLMSSVLSDSIPSLNLANKTRFDIMMADSAIITSDYELNVPHTNSNNIKTAKGTLQLVIYRRSSGWWTIHRWTDSKRQTDSTETWSIMKAQFN
jgi:hypothetical protein